MMTPLGLLSLFIACKVAEALLIPNDAEVNHGSPASGSQEAMKPYKAEYVDAADLVSFLSRSLEPDGSHTPLPRYRTSGGDTLTYPLFLVLGARKGGSTGLRITLLNHPSLSLDFDATSAKPQQFYSGLCETHYFDMLRYYDDAIAKSGLADTAPVLGSDEGAPLSAAAVSGVASLLEYYVDSFGFNTVPLHEPGSALAMDCVSSPHSDKARKAIGDTVQDGRFIFDTTATYLATPTTPYFIKKLMPHVRMVVLLRDPFDRYMSDLNMVSCQPGMDSHEGRSFHTIGNARAYIAKFSHGYATYKERCQGRLVTYYDLRHCQEFHLRYLPLLSGLYADHLERYLGLFDRSQILTVHSDELFTNYLSVLERITSFVGLPPFDWASLLSQYNTHRNGGDEAERLKMCPEGYMAYENMVEQMRATDDEVVLREFYRDANERLFSLLGVDYGWNDRIPPGGD